jgi:putative phosphoribosyl transferase
MTHRQPSECDFREVVVDSHGKQLPGLLTLPHDARSAVAFAHGSGSGRLSPRNQFVARKLNESGIATLLFDLLDDAEADDRASVFDIDLLAERLDGAAGWLANDKTTRRLRVGYFGASTGAAAALVAAARRPDRVYAVVSRGGRPDLAGRDLRDVRTPTLLIVGGDDDAVVGLNEAAATQIPATCELVVIPGASHLFPEPGAIEQVANLAADWFTRYLAPGCRSAQPA